MEEKKPIEMWTELARSFIFLTQVYWQGRYGPSPGRLRLEIITTLPANVWIGYRREVDREQGGEWKGKLELFYNGKLSKIVKSKILDL